MKKRDKGRRCRAARDGQTTRRKIRKGVCKGRIAGTGATQHRHNLYNYVRTIHNLG